MAEKKEAAAQEPELSEEQKLLNKLGENARTGGPSSVAGQGSVNEREWKNSSLGDPDAGKPAEKAENA